MALGATRAPLARRLAQVVETQTSIARAGLDGPAVLRLVAAQAKELTSAAGAALVGVAGPNTTVLSAAGTAAPLLAGVETNVLGIAAEVVSQGAPGLWPDAGGEPGSAAAVPVRVRSQVVAALVVVGERPGTFSGEDVQVLQLLAGLAGAAILAGQAPAEVRAADAERLAHLSTHDPLTMLPNRALFGDRLRHALSLARRHRTRLCIMAVDLEGFEDISARLGPAAGDEVLRMVAERLRLTLREPDTLARLAGGEFVMLLSGDVTPEAARAIEARVRRALEAPATAGGVSSDLRAGVGLAFYPFDGDDAHLLVRRALASVLGDD